MLTANMFTFEPTSNFTNLLQSADMTRGWNNDGNYLQTPTYGGASLGQEYLMNDAGDISSVYGAATGSQSSFSLFSSHHSSAPAPTLVGSSTGLQIELVWDSSVASAPSGFTTAITDAAEYYTSLFSNKALVEIDVGWGEIDGSPLAADALGESESYGYITNGSTSELVGSALDKDTYAPTSTASSWLEGSQLWVNTAEAKALGLVNPTSGLDGYIGFSALGSSYSWNTAAVDGPSNSGTGSYQFDLQAVAAHEMTEVMGRIGMEGTESANGEPLYTPLDGFNYYEGALGSNKGGSFTVNGAALGVYNDNAAYGGDIADWASDNNGAFSAALSMTGVPSGDYDDYDAFTGPGYNGVVSAADVVEDAALGYGLTSAGVTAAAGAV